MDNDFVFTPLPRHEWDLQLRRENAQKARAMVNHLARSMPSLKETLAEPKHCPGCRALRPLIRYAGNMWLCRQCANARDAHHAQRGAPLFVDGEKGYL